MAMAMTTDYHLLEGTIGNADKFISVSFLHEKTNFMYSTSYYNEKFSLEDVMQFLRRDGENVVKWMYVVPGKRLPLGPFNTFVCEFIFQYLIMKKVSPNERLVEVNEKNRLSFDEAISHFHVTMLVEGRRTFATLRFLPQKAVIAVNGQEWPLVRVCGAE